MASKISTQTAKDYVDNYFSVSVAQGVKENEIVKSFAIDREFIEDIFKKADDAGMNCTGLRIYLGKKTKTNPELPKFSTPADYNLIILGSDDNNNDITTTGEIYDNLILCPSDCPKTGL